MADIGTELANVGEQATQFFEKDLPAFFQNLGTQITNAFSGGGGDGGAVSVPEIPPAPTFAAPAAPSFTAAAPSFSAPDVSANAGGGDFDIGQFFTADLGKYANTAMTWVEANPATFTLWVLVVVTLILACVGIGMAAAMPTSIPVSVPTVAPVAPAPPPAAPMPFTVATNGDVSFPGNVTFAGNATVKGGLAVTGQTTVTGLNLTQNLSVNSLTVNGALQASNITATGSLTSNANSNLGGTTSLSGALNGDANSTITAGTISGTTQVNSKGNKVVARTESIVIDGNGVDNKSGVGFMLGIDKSTIGSDSRTVSNTEWVTSTESDYNTNLRIT